MTLDICLENSTAKFAFSIQRKKKKSGREKWWDWERKREREITRKRDNERKREEREELIRFNLDLWQTLVFHQPPPREILYSPFSPFSHSLPLQTQILRFQLLIYVLLTWKKPTIDARQKRRTAAENRSLLNVEACPSHSQSILGWLWEFGYCAGRRIPIKTMREMH